MRTKRTVEFRQKAVRVALTSGLTRKQIAVDFGIGFSTLSKWIQQGRKNSEMPTDQSELERENVQLRKENRLLREEREVLKGNTVLREPKAMRFKFIDENKAMLSTARLCQILHVSPRGYRAYRSRPISSVNVMTWYC